MHEKTTTTWMLHSVAGMRESVMHCCDGRAGSRVKIAIRALRTNHPLPRARRYCGTGAWGRGALLRCALPHLGHVRGCPVLPYRIAWSRRTRSGSSEAAYASIAAMVALFLRSAKTILSYVSRFVCQVYWRYSA